MTVNFDDWVLLARLGFYLIPPVLLFSGIGVWLYCMFGKDFKIMEDMVSSNVRLQAIVVSNTCTFRGRWFFVAGYAAVLSLADMFIRRGQLLPEDIAEVPKSLRKRLRWGEVMMFTGLAWIMVIWMVKIFTD